MKQRKDKENEGKLKPKDHTGKLERYDFDKDGFLTEMKEIPEGQIVNWTQQARKYDLRINGRFPLNGGQIMAKYARINGINIDKYNTSINRSGRDYNTRVRRGKKRLKYGIPTSSVSRSVKIKKEV